MVAKRRARVLSRLVLILLLAIIALAAVPYGTVDLWWIALLECSIFAVGVLWLVEGLVCGSWFVSEHRLLLPPLAIIAFAIVQLLPFGRSMTAGIETSWTISADPFETQLWIFRMGSYVLTGALLLRYTSDPRRLRQLVYFVVVLGVACALFGISRQTLQHEPGFLLSRLMPGNGYAQFINRNHFAFLMEMTLGLLLGLMAVSGARRERLLIYLAAAVPVWVSLVLSNSRGGILSMLLQLLFAIIMFQVARPLQNSSRTEKHVRFKWLNRLSRSLAFRTLLVVCLLAASLFGVLWIGGESLTSRLEAMHEDESGAVEGSQANTSHTMGETRAEIWRATWDLSKSHLIAGSGFGGYWTAVTKYHAATGEMSLQQAHNDYLELLASGGIIGVGLVVWFVIVFIKQVRQRLRSPDAFRRAACFGALISLFGIAVHSCVDFGLHVTINALVCTLLIVIATVNERVEEQSASHRRSRSRSSR